jgi:tetratricopeptide (TPR) repeat protein
MNLHEPPDSHHYRAAMGWLELGNHLEANEELEQISPLNRAHLDVLELRWKVYEKAKRWEVCTELAEAMKLKAPVDPRGTIYLAQTHYGQKQYQSAYDVLSPAVHQFPDRWWVWYDLACYACLLGKHEEATECLEKAFSLDQGKEAKLRSLEDPDLKGLWATIGSLPSKDAGTSEQD